MARPQLRPVGRPGEDRASKGRIRATILPEIKGRCEQIVESDSRLPSFSRMVELALSYYADCYDKADGVLDKRGFPVIR
ncbi:MAG: hypothetical protein ABIU97_03970 [Dehalococcoidia bacterium]